MGIRREARERAVQFLFQYDLNPPDDLVGALAAFWASQLTPDKEPPSPSSESGSETDTGDEEEAPSLEHASLRLFAEPLIKGVVEHREELDAQIRKYVKNWEIQRIAVVDRNILRLAIFEMFHREDIPPVVSINEAVDIAKKFSTDESGRFVNGVLDRIRLDLMRPSRIVK